MIKAIRHELIKDGAGNIKYIVIGIIYTDDITGRTAYREVIFDKSELSAMPTKLELMAKVKAWMTNVPEFETVLPNGIVQKTKGESVLQLMKKETQNIETLIVFKKGHAGSLIDETI